MYKKQNNPVALKSQQMIQEALLALIAEKTYNEITVTEICKKADIVRKTFYRNFNCKDDVINYMLDSALSIMLTYLDLEKMNMLNIFVRVYIFILENKEFLILFYKSSLFHLISKRLVSFINEKDLFTKFNHEKIKKHYYKYLPSQIIATIVSIVEVWIESGFSDTPFELARLTEDIMYGKLYV